jgi:hypothetical protein
MTVVRVLATRLARVIGVAVLLYSGVVFFGNVLGAAGGAKYDSLEILLVIVAVGAVGLAGSVVFLLSIDGPQSWRTTIRRAVGWLGMMIAALLPTSWLFLIAPVTAIGGLSLLLSPDRSDRDGLRSG